MTRAEMAISNLKYAQKWNDRPADEVIKIAIEALEQKPILDKIRAEIGMYYADCTSMSQGDCEECTENVFQSIFRIIDKYREGEEE